MTTDEAEARAHEACLLRNLRAPFYCDGKWLYAQSPATFNGLTKIPCPWPGHAAIRDLRREAFRAGLERAASVAETTVIRCAECGGQNEHEICDVAGPTEIAAAIRALAEAADGD